MKSQGAVSHKLKQVLFRHLQRRIREALKVTPENCQHNGNLGLEGIPSFCLKGAGTPEWNSVVCDRTCGGLELARSCEFYTARLSVEEIKEEFRSFIQTASMAEIAQEFPDAAALLWVLDQGGEDFDFDFEEVTPNLSDESESVEPLAQVPWWRKVLGLG